MRNSWLPPMNAVFNEPSSKVTPRRRLAGGLIPGPDQQHNGAPPGNRGAPTQSARWAGDFARSLPDRWHNDDALVVATAFSGVGIGWWVAVEA